MSVAPSSASLLPREANASASTSSPSRTSQPETGPAAANNSSAAKTAEAASRPAPSIPPVHSAAAETAFGLDGGDRRFVTWAALIALVLMSVHWWRITAWSPAPVRVERPPGDGYRFLLDINQATWVEWMQVEGVGETLARRIVANRKEFGPFPDVNALQRVPGVGEKTLERIREHATIRPPVNVETGRRPDEG
jgi:competence protein ComEA